MKSNKTEVLSFDKWFGEASQNKLFWESPSKASKMRFEAGQQSKQDEIDHLQEKIDEAIYDLQHIESAMWEEQVDHVLMILKGEYL